MTARVKVHPSDPIHLARAYLDARHKLGSDSTLVNAWDTWYRYARTNSYVEFRLSFLTSDIGRFLDSVDVMKPVKQGKESVLQRSPLLVNRAIVAEVLAAIQRLVPQLEGAAPMWTDEHETDATTDPKDLLPCDNGFLNLRTFELQDATPRLFTLAAVPVPWLDDPPEPKRWLQFLSEVWPNDPDAIRLLRQMFGYLMTFDTSAHKSFMLIGATRSGKGTISRVLKALLGESYVGMSLDMLDKQFGLAPLVGKKLGAIGDARLSNKADTATIVSRILTITGEDAIPVDRKNKDIESIVMSARFLILTNELPKLYDSSSAFVNRFMVLHFEGQIPDDKQDHDLTSKLIDELPGIFKWAIEGLIDLRQTRRFVMPDSSRRALDEFLELSSPIMSFVQDQCVVGEEYSADSDDLFHAFGEWCESNGRDRVPNKQTFTSMLRAAFPKIHVLRYRDKDAGREYGAANSYKRAKRYMGIGLLTSRDDESDPPAGGNDQGKKYLI